MRSTPRSTTRTRERRCLGCARLAADAYANFDRDVERLHGDDPAVDPLGGVLPQPCGFPLAFVHRHAVCPQRHRHDRAVVVIHAHVAALEPLRTLELGYRLVERLDGFLRPVGLHFVPCDSGEHTRNPNGDRGVLPTKVVSRPPEDSEFVERARRGDEDAYEELVRAHQGIAFRTAYVISGNASDAEEAAQEAFVKAYRALGRFRTGSPFRPWLLRIVANEARNRRRSAGRRAVLAVRAAGEGRPSGEAAPSPEAALLAGERRAMLVTALNGLAERD